MHNTSFKDGGDTVLFEFSFDREQTYLSVLEDDIINIRTEQNGKGWDDYDYGYLVTFFFFFF